MLIKAKVVAERLDLPLQRIYAMARQGLFPAGILVRFSSSLRWNDELLTEWINNGGTTPTQASEQFRNEKKED